MASVGGPSYRVFEFRGFRADTRQGVLLRGREIVPLAPKAFDLLVALIESGGRVVSKDELMKRVWPDTVVEEANLSHQIYKLREALDDTNSPGCIQTVPRRGYRFAAAVTEHGQAPGMAAVPTVRWGDREIPLSQGANLLGRTPDCLIRIDSVSVSREHARILLDGEDAVIEDLQSKNGTFVNGTRVETSVPLRDGDEIRIGTVPMRFHAIGAPLSTRTVGRSS